MSTDAKLQPLYSFSDIERRKFKTLEFSGDWLDLIGRPEVSGSWLTWGLSGNGKTRFSLMLAKYLAGFEKVYYNSLEEGLKLSFRMALESVNMKSVGARFGFQQESFEKMCERLRQKRSPNIVFIDSLQYLGINVQQYKDLKEEFPNKLFCFISHAQGMQPKGDLADAIRYDADVKIRVHQFVASPVENTRYGGSTPLVIWEEGMRKAQLKLT